MSKIKALVNGFVFKFNDEVNNKGEFNKSPTQSGIILKASSDDSAKQPRWVTITSRGTTCADYIQPGVEVLLPALRWTASAEVDGEKFWKSDDTQVVAYKDKDTGNIIPVNKYVLFAKSKISLSTTDSGLIVAGNMSEGSPHGVVLNVSADVYPEIITGTVIYIVPNSESTIEQVSTRLITCFVKEDDILAYENA